MTIQHLLICGIETQYSPEYIVNVLWKQRIAKATSITCLPNLNSDSFNAYITIGQWCDSEVAYNFIKRLQYSYIETRIVHNDENWWNVYTFPFNIGGPLPEYTTQFDTNYFDKPLKKLANDSSRPILGLYGEQFNPTEAREQLVKLTICLQKHPELCFEGSFLDQEIQHLRNELRIHKAVQNSKFVTPRRVSFECGV